MAEQAVHLALFREDQINEAAEALSHLRELGVRDRDISVISGVPLSDRVLGRPISWTRITQIGIAGAVVGFVIAVALSLGTPYLYPLKVGRLPIFPIPTTIVVVFELTMLGLLISTFLGVLVETLTPSFGPRGYHASVTDGHIGILFSSAGEQDSAITSALQSLGADLAEVQKL